MEATGFDVNKHITREKLNFGMKKTFIFSSEGKILYCMSGKARNYYIQYFTSQDEKHHIFMTINDFVFITYTTAENSGTFYTTTVYQ